MSIVTNDIAENVLSGIIGINGVRRNLDSSSDERRCITVTPEDIIKYESVFRYNGGTMSDGKYLKVNGSTFYERIPVNISMLDQNDNSLRDPDVLTLEERALKNLPSLQVFVDGNKIPDHEVKMYPTKSNVDLLIPLKYIDREKGNKIIVEKRRYDIYRYVHLYVESTSVQNHSIDIGSLNVEMFKERTVQIYVNKKLYNSSRNIRVNNGKLSVEITTELTDVELEVIVDPYVMYYFPFNSLSYGSKPIFEIPESYIDSIHGPISKFSCMFYVNGLRVPNTEVDQKGRLHFEYNDDSFTGGNVSFYLSDRNVIVDTNDILYGSDYYLYNFIGCDAITKAIKTSLSGYKYIDAGAHKTIGGLEATYKLGTTNIKLYLSENVIISEKDVSSAVLTLGNKVVDKDDITINNKVNPVEITISNPSKYLKIGSSAYVDITFTSWFGWDEVLNRNGDLFSREKVKEIIKIYNSGFDASTKVANALKDRPYLMRTFLENYGYDRYIKQINYNGTGAYVYAGISPNIDVSTGKNYDVSVNNKHISSSDITIINKDVTDVFQIEGKYFDTGDNEVEIQVFDDAACEYFAYKPSDIKNYDGINILEVKGKFTPDRLGDIESNIILLEKVDSTVPGVANFATDSNIGYRLFEGFTPMYDSTSDTVFITFDGATPDREFIVYNKNFSSLYKYTKPLDGDIADVVVPLYMGTESNPIPYISRGKIIVYSGTERLVEGLDYFLKDPSTLSTVGCSFLILKRAVLPGSSIDIYFTNVKTNVIYNKTGYFSNNKYGLFYFSSLKFPFSLKYMNMYINGQKLSEDDVDILSDKLVRVHSLPVPMYDLCIESAFTVDIVDLEPYILEYKEDNFELYLASLFRAVSYDREFEYDESAYNVNEVYAEFIDTVDSVNKKPNPKSREGVWIPEYTTEEDGLVGISSNGSVVKGNTINASLIVGNAYIVGADNGKIASCSINNEKCVWTPCYSDSSDSIHSDGSEVNDEDITALALYKGYIVIGTREGHIYAYNPTTNVWMNSDFELCNISNTWPEGVSINGFLIDAETDSLYMYGDDGNVDSFNFTTGVWNGTSYQLEYSGVGVTGVMGDIHAAFMTSKNNHQILVVLGENGEAASCYVEYNTWVKPDGESMYNNGLVPPIYDDGTSRDNKDIYAVVKYSDDYVLLGEDGKVSYYSNSNRLFSDRDTLNISNDGIYVYHKNINAAIQFNDKFIVTGCDVGKVSEYVGENQGWLYCDSNTGITSAGRYMAEKSIKTMQITPNSTNYIIFAGEDGKVSSYNIDVDEVPYRYDPYKTCFLKWYTTAGNAIINSVWDIPDDVAAKFDMYREDGDNGDICIRGGDNDVMMDIDMNDNGEYPRLVKSRKRFVANFIKSLPAGRYTPAEIEKAYKESAAKNMLYCEDVESIVFASGDELDIDEDIDLTSIK